MTKNGRQGPRKPATKFANLRAVIAQILDYASSFADLSDDQLIEMFAEQHDESAWADLIATLFGNDVDGDELSEVLKEWISTGQLNLVIACDKVPIGLPEIVRGVSTQCGLSGKTATLTRRSLTTPKRSG
jgi:hypothetical protein